MNNRLENIISDQRYILDCLTLLKRILDSGNCNECKIIKTCKYAPCLGEQVRYNCPHFIKE